MALLVDAVAQGARQTQAGEPGQAPERPQESEPLARLGRLRGGGIRVGPPE